MPKMIIHVTAGELHRLLIELSPVVHPDELRLGHHGCVAYFGKILIKYINDAWVDGKIENGFMIDNATPFDICVEASDDILMLIRMKL